MGTCDTSEPRALRDNPAPRTARALPACEPGCSVTVPAAETESVEITRVPSSATAPGAETSTAAVPSSGGGEPPAQFAASVQLRVAPAPVHVNEAAPAPEDTARIATAIWRTVPRTPVKLAPAQRAQNVSSCGRRGAFAQNRTRPVRHGPPPRQIGPRTATSRELPPPVAAPRQVHQPVSRSRRSFKRSGGRGDRAASRSLALVARGPAAAVAVGRRGRGNFRGRRTGRRARRAVGQRGNRRRAAPRPRRHLPRHLPRSARAVPARRAAPRDGAGGNGRGTRLARPAPGLQRGALPRHQAVVTCGGDDRGDGVRTRAGGPRRQCARPGARSARHQDRPRARARSVRKRERDRVRSSPAPVPEVAPARVGERGELGRCEPRRAGALRRGGRREPRGDRGRLGVLEERAPGVFRIAFRAPDVAGGAARVRAALSHDAAPAQVVSIALRAGAPASIQLQPSAAQIAGAGEVVLRAEVLDTRGNALRDQPVAFSTDYGELAASGPTARLRVPAAHEGRRRARIRARAASAEGVVDVDLRPGPAARAIVQLARSEVREGHDVEATVQLSDAAGNPIEGAALEVEAERARAEPAREIREGIYSVRVRVGDAPGPASLVVRSGVAVGRARLAVIPDERADGIAIGGLVWGQSNLSRAWGGAAAIELSVHPGLRPIELVARAGLLQFAPARSALAGSDAIGRGDLRGLSLAVGARASVALLGSWALHATVSGGALRTFGTLTVDGGAAAGVRQGTAQWGPLGAIAAGTTLRIGPGRAIAELQYTAAPGRGDLSGNLGGLTVCAGYLFALR